MHRLTYVRERYCSEFEKEKSIVSCFFREITTLLIVRTQRTNVRTYSVVGDGLHVALHEKLKRGGSLAPVHGFPNAMLAS